ncbi:hypothetical protein Anas_07421 [Armadillidium nasatum]|uniref:Uncharacterized protein n=1 Tax=Armadillidium nasatum TaxID=96803 RepID=A0A5N5TK64_9CRUS|nr:hypothetical protein Anas_07421 [Armadillidium nasatum]
MVKKLLDVRELECDAKRITYIKRRNCIIKCSQEKLRLISELFVITYSKCKPALIPETVTVIRFVNSKQA